eukprot:947049-Prymnesium_polylepis.1
MSSPRDRAGRRAHGRRAGGGHARASWTGVDGTRMSSAGMNHESCGTPLNSTKANLRRRSRGAMSGRRSSASLLRENSQSSGPWSHGLSSRWRTRPLPAVAFQKG